MDRWLFGLFLAAAAGQDWRKKQVSVWTYVLFGGLTLLYVCVCLWSGTGDYEWRNHFGGIFLGLVLLVLSAVSRGMIGIGDGCFFFISGILLETGDILLLFCYGMLLCGLYCLGYLVWLRFQRAELREMRQRTVPFLPFLIAPAMWIL